LRGDPDLRCQPAHRANPGGSLEATRRSFNKDFLLALTADFKKLSRSSENRSRDGLAGPPLLAGNFEHCHSHR